MNVTRFSKHSQREAFMKSKETHSKSAQKPLDSGYWRVPSSSNGSKATRLLLSGAMVIVSSLLEPTNIFLVLANL